MKGTPAAFIGMAQAEKLPWAAYSLCCSMRQDWNSICWQKQSCKITGRVLALVIVALLNFLTCHWGKLALSIEHVPSYLQKSFPRQRLLRALLCLVSNDTKVSCIKRRVSLHLTSPAASKPSSMAIYHSPPLKTRSWWKISKQL